MKKIFICSFVALVMILLISIPLFSQDDEDITEPVRRLIRSEMETTKNELEATKNELKDAQKNINKLEDENQVTENELKDAQKSINMLESENQTLKATLLTILKILEKIQTNLENGNPWEPFSKDIRDVAAHFSTYNHNADPENQPKAPEYEYAILRCGTFTKLTVSTWNSGFRVITEPYMTGQTPYPNSAHYMLGGSMWVWENAYDKNDDKGVFHYYWYFTKNGCVTADGNGLTKAESGGEGWIYRRKLK